MRPTSTSSRTRAITTRATASPSVKYAHWLFDNGLWTLTDDYKVIVAEGEFVETGAEQKLLREYHGKKILLRDEPALRPNPIHIAWHRRKKFKER
jgi:putative restriction endonuclease